jgi:hypothetical protein
LFLILFIWFILKKKFLSVYNFHMFFGSSLSKKTAIQLIRQRIGETLVQRNRWVMTYIFVALRSSRIDLIYGSSLPIFHSHELPPKQNYDNSSRYLNFQSPNQFGPLIFILKANVSHNDIVFWLMAFIIWTN